MGSSEEKAKLDILFVLDTSGSMAKNLENDRTGGESRRKVADEAIRGLVDDLSGDPTAISTRLTVTDLPRCGATAI